MPHGIWSLVLAAGAGRRLRALTGQVPKQFWSPDGRHTLLDDTLERTALFSQPDQTVVVVDRTHARFVSSLRQRTGARHWLHQPCDRGTAAGVLLGLAHIHRLAPDAMVLLTPSDHGVACVSTFGHGIRRAIDALAADRARIVLFGAAPDGSEVDYGWITPGRGSVGGFAPVAGFVEKPPADVARALSNGGAVWNTMVLVGRVADLIDLCRQTLPDLCSVLVDDAEAGFVDDGAASIYPSIRRADFSRDVLGVATGLSVYVWPETMGWSDLGTPARLAAWQSSQAAKRSRRRLTTSAALAS